MEIKQRYTHSAFGNFMFRLCAKWTKFITRHRVLYGVLACTWGGLLTLLGLLISLVLGIAKLFDASIQFYPYLWVYGIQVGTGWGGFETGLMFLRDRDSRCDSLDAHEFGHTLQNVLLGPFTIFLVTIPSAARYWFREFTPNKKHAPYDAFWAEDSASMCGEYATQLLSR